MHKLKVKKDETGRRLDLWLADKLSLSRSKTQKIIRIGKILVNNKIANAHYKIRENDEICTVKFRPNENFAENKIISKGSLPEFKIIRETDGYLIINKPAGVIVHGDGSAETSPSHSAGKHGASLADALLKKYPEIKKVGDDPARPGIVHRLDKEVSGLMVIAKNNKIFDHLKIQFQKRAVVKKYQALIYGATGKDEDLINFPIARSAKGYKMAALPRRSPERLGTKAGQTKNQKVRQAITEFTVKKRFINYALLDITIKTGRTHQIRAHLSAYGHPIVGDNLYSTKKTREKNAKLKLNRIFLHAYLLGFYNLRNEWKEFRVEIPAELKTLLKNIK